MMVLLGSSSPEESLLGIILWLHYAVYLHRSALRTERTHEMMVCKQELGVRRGEGWGEVDDVYRRSKHPHIVYGANVSNYLLRL